MEPHEAEDHPISSLLSAHPLNLPIADFLSGIFISNELLGLMTLRYSDKSGLVSFPSLVCFLIRLETMASK